MAITAASKMEGAAFDQATIDDKVWYAITARAYGRIQAAGRSSKTDIANRNYGLRRGLVAAFLGCLISFGLFQRDQFEIIAGFSVALIAVFLRGRVAGEHYARSLFIAFIDLSAGAP